MTFTRKSSMSCHHLMDLLKNFMFVIILMNICLETCIANSKMRKMLKRL